MNRRLAATTALILIAAAFASARATVEENRRFVGQLFRDLLERPASSVELAALTELAGSSGRAYAVRYVQGSLERYNRLLQDFHRDYLKRDPAPGETTQWLASLRKSGAAEPVRAGILASSESYGRQGNASAWVQKVYRSVLGRNPSSAEAKVAPATVASVSSRTQFVAKVLDSAEARTGLIHELYLDLLGRRANPAEVGHWLTMLSKGVGEEGVRAVILSSDEYFGMAQSIRRG